MYVYYAQNSKKIQHFCFSTKLIYSCVAANDLASTGKQPVKLSQLPQASLFQNKTKREADKPKFKKKNGQESVKFTKGFVF